MCRKYIRLAFIAFALCACSKEPYNTEKEPVAEPFTGAVETGADVDLGLKARWAGYNVGANAPEEYGNYYAWGETSAKEEYLESSYTYLPAGTVLSGSLDVASKEMGYGYQMPSEDDIQELIDSCSFKFCSYNGVNGWIATSKVKGYEGKSIFFPAAGYAAGRNVNYQGSYAVFWSTEQVLATNKRSKNAFFKDSSLNLNTPPKGVGGLSWCGYSVRAIRKFILTLDATEIKVPSDTTSVTVQVSGNAKWTASVTGADATIQPNNGFGDAVIKVTFPINATEEARTFGLKVSSAEISKPIECTITQFGITPDFKIDGNRSESIAWDDTTATCSLKASPTVSWTATVRLNGKIVAGAKVIPSSGTGSASDINVVVPTSGSVRDTTEYSVDFTTTDARIPQELATVSYKVRQAPTIYVPFSDTAEYMDSLFYKKLVDSCTLTGSYYTLSKTVTFDNIKITPKGTGTTCRVYFGKKNYINYKWSCQFTSASSGDALLVLYCAIGGSKSLSISWKDKDGQSKTVPSEVLTAISNKSSSNVYYDTDAKALQLHLPGVEVGDVISLSGTSTGNHIIYKFLWKEDKIDNPFGEPGEPGKGGEVEDYPGTL